MSKHSLQALRFYRVIVAQSFYVRAVLLFENLTTVWSVLIKTESWEDIEWYEKNQKDEEIVNERKRWFILKVAGPSWQDIRHAGHLRWYSTYLSVKLFSSFEILEKSRITRAFSLRIMWNKSRIFLWLSINNKNRYNSDWSCFHGCPISDKTVIRISQIWKAILFVVMVTGVFSAAYMHE